VSQRSRRKLRHSSDQDYLTPKQKAPSRMPRKRYSPTQNGRL